MVAEKEGTAIHRLAVQTAKYMPWHAVKIVCVHPKRPSPQQIQEFEQGLEWCDVVDFRYWKTAEMLQSMFAIKKPTVLTHYNPYDINKSLWQNYSQNVVVNETQRREIKAPAQYIPLPVDLNFWEVNRPDAVEKKYDIIMVANRIEGKKGILPVAEIAKEEGLKMALVGDISDPDYYEKVIATGAVEFFHRITDEELRELYQQSRMHICNSIDNYESGTLPILESMAIGVPVITRRIGHVPELFNGRNLIVRTSPPEEKEELRGYIRQILTNPEQVKEMVSTSRDTVKYRNYDLQARAFSRIYHKLVQPKELVTAIVPTIATPEKLAKVLAAIMTQSYGVMEIIVVDDSEQPAMNKDLIEMLRSQSHFTLKFYTSATYAMDEKGEPYKTYGLARARNKAIVEAEGQWLWFVDDRMIPSADALEKFYERRKEKVWLWGIKDGVKKGFVENFSFVQREDLIRIGMFNEQLTQYGGMTQDIRTRWEKMNRNQVEMVGDATAVTERKSTSKWKRYSDIAKSKTLCYKLYG